MGLNWIQLVRPRLAEVLEDLPEDLGDDLGLARRAPRRGLALPGVRFGYIHGPYWLSSIEHVSTAK